MTLHINYELLCENENKQILSGSCIVHLWFIIVINDDFIVAPTAEIDQRLVHW